MKPVYFAITCVPQARKDLRPHSPTHPGAGTITLSAPEILHTSSNASTLTLNVEETHAPNSPTNTPTATPAASRSSSHVSLVSFGNGQLTPGRLASPMSQATLSRKGSSDHFHPSDPLPEARTYLASGARLGTASTRCSFGSGLDRVCRHSGDGRSPELTTRVPSPTSKLGSVHSAGGASTSNRGSGWCSKDWVGHHAPRASTSCRDLQHPRAASPYSPISSPGLDQLLDGSHSSAIPLPASEFYMTAGPPNLTRISAPVLSTRTSRLDLLLDQQTPAWPTTLNGLPLPPDPTFSDGHQAHTQWALPYPLASIRTSHTSTRTSPAITPLSAVTCANSTVFAKAGRTLDDCLDRLTEGDHYERASHVHLAGASPTNGHLHGLSGLLECPIAVSRTSSAGSMTLDQLLDRSAYLAAPAPWSPAGNSGGSNSGMVLHHSAFAPSVSLQHRPSASPISIPADGSGLVLGGERSLLRVPSQPTMAAIYERAQRNSAEARAHHHHHHTHHHSPPSLPRGPHLARTGGSGDHVSAGGSAAAPSRRPAVPCGT